MTVKELREKLKKMPDDYLVTLEVLKYDPNSSVIGASSDKDIIVYETIYNTVCIQGHGAVYSGG